MAGDPNASPNEDRSGARPFHSPWSTSIQRPGTKTGPAVAKDGLRINGEILARQIRLIDADGSMIGVIPTREALMRAAELELDLVEVSPMADPPVCKILDYGKFKYESQKKKAEARKKQKIIEVKEIKLRPNIDDHDYEVKVNHMKRFIGEGDKVKVTLRFKGREMAHSDRGLEVLKRVREELEAVVKVESEPRLEGRQMIMILAPKA